MQPCLLCPADGQGGSQRKINRLKRSLMGSEIHGKEQFLAVFHASYAFALAPETVRSGGAALLDLYRDGAAAWLRQLDEHWRKI